jgi:thiamine pyrophosphokinase
MEKAINYALKKGYKSIICVGAMGGRMDHTLSAISTTQKICTHNKDVDIIIFG